MLPANMINSVEPKPFIRVDEEHLIPVHRITEIGFVEKGLVYKVGDEIYFSNSLASEHAQENDSKIEEIKTPILVIHYLNDKNEGDYIRRTGRFAMGLWEVLTTFMAIP